MAYESDWVDAFTTEAFGGNACVVVHDADDITLADRLALVRETSLSECAYLQQSDKADFGARYYLAEREIPMAGHPTIATVISLLHRGKVALTDGQASFTLEVGSGVLDIDVTRTDRGPLVTMTQARPEFGEICEARTIAGIYGLDPANILGTPQVVSTGTPFCITILNNRAALNQAELDVEKLSAWQQSLSFCQWPNIKPYLAILEGATDQGDSFARLFLTRPTPFEDPFTGSATGCLGAYLWAHGLIKAPQFRHEQGHGLGRPGSAQVEVLGPPDDISGVRVSGQGRVLMSGALLI